MGRTLAEVVEKVVSATNSIANACVDLSWPNRGTIASQYLYYITEMSSNRAISIGINSMIHHFVADAPNKRVELALT